MKYILSMTIAVLLTTFSVRSAGAQAALVALTNSDVMRLVAMRVPDLIVIAVINAAPVTQLDVSASAISDLAIFGVSSAVIAAMRHPSTPAPGVQAEAVSIPQGTPPEATSPRVTTATFEPVYRAAKTVQGSTQSGVTYVKFGELMQTFSTALSIASDHSLNDNDRQLLALYQEAYDAYHFSAAIWEITLNAPRGSLILATLLNEQTIKHYGLTMEFVSTQLSIRTPVIAGDSMQRVWRQADAILKSATPLYLGK